MAEDVSAERFVEMLQSRRSPIEVENIQRYVKPGADDGARDVFIGVRMGDVFGLAKEFIDMPPSEIERLLENPVHEVRAGGLSIMGKQAARKKTPESRRKELFELYLSRTDRINNWDLVDISAHHVIGGYLLDKPRHVLYELARSERWWERRIAMFSTMAFVRRGDLDDTYKIAEILLGDSHDLIHKVVGGMLREAGKHDRARLSAFLDLHAATMPRVLLRYAIEHLDDEQRAHYMNLKRQVGQR